MPEIIHDNMGSGSTTTKYEHVLPLLAGLEESDEIDGLLLLLNTVGGDIEAGLAIAEMIAGMKKPTVSLVLGGGHSIGIPLAVCTKKSFITPTASMTVHPVPEDSGTDCRFCHSQFPDQPGDLRTLYDGHRRNGNRRGNNPLWERGGLLWPD